MDINFIVITEIFLFIKFVQKEFRKCLRTKMWRFKQNKIKNLQILYF